MFIPEFLCAKAANKNFSKLQTQKLQYKIQIGMKSGVKCDNDNDD